MRTKEDWVPVLESIECDPVRLIESIDAMSTPSEHSWYIHSLTVSIPARESDEGGQ